MDVAPDPFESAGLSLRAATIAVACDQAAVERSVPPTSRAWPSRRGRAIAAVAMREASRQSQSDVQRNVAAIARGPSTDLPATMTAMKAGPWRIDIDTNVDVTTSEFLLLLGPLDRICLGRRSGNELADLLSRRVKSRIDGADRDAHQLGDVLA